MDFSEWKATSGHPVLPLSKHEVPSLHPMFLFPHFEIHQSQTLFSRYSETTYTSLHLSLQGEAPPSLTISSVKHLLNTDDGWAMAEDKEVHEMYPLPYA